MLNENAKKWVKALRGGKYHQTRGVLADKNGHCCLGVACEVARKNGVDVSKYYNPTNGLYYYDSKEDLLPLSVQEWLGLWMDNGQYKDNDGNIPALSEHNDDGMRFTEIADLIEKYADTLFVKGK